MGGTAVGTGLNSPVGFGDDARRANSPKLTGFSDQDRTTTSSPRKERWIAWCARTTALQDTRRFRCFKIANDMRWLGSGPRSRDP